MRSLTAAAIGCGFTGVSFLQACAKGLAYRHVRSSATQELAQSPAAPGLHPQCEDELRCDVLRQCDVRSFDTLVLGLLREANRCHRFFRGPLRPRRAFGSADAGKS